MFIYIPLPFYPEIRFTPFRQGYIHKAILKYNPDYIHIDTESALGLAGRQACVSLWKNFTTAYHTNFPEYFEARTGLSGEWVFTYLRWFHSQSKYTMVSTDFLKKDLKKHKFEHLVVRPLGVDTDIFKKNKGIVVTHNQSIFLYLGRLAIEKGVEDFLRCELPGEKWIVWDGPQREDLETRYPEARFFGYKKWKSLVNILSSVDVLVLPSHTETFWLVALEALSCSVPVAAYPAPGPSYIISDGIDGILSNDLCDAAIRCLSIDRTNCRKKALMYSWENSAKSFIKNLVEANPWK